MRKLSFAAVMFVAALTYGTTFGCGKSKFSGQPDLQKRIATTATTGDSGSGIGADSSSAGGTSGDSTGSGSGSGSDASTTGAGTSGSSSGTGADGSSTASSGVIPKCSTLQKFTFVGIKINDVVYRNRGSSEGQCNTSCHWQVQPADLKTKVGCSTRDCHVPGTVDDSLCNTCDYYKEVCQL